MQGTGHSDARKLPGRFDELVRMMPPQAIADDVQHEQVVEMMNRLMAAGRLTRGQESYLETLVQLVEAYEARHHAFDTTITGIDLLKHLLEENEMTATDLAQVLGVHASLGSKILKGQRALTLPHIRKLARRFKLAPEAFLDPL